MSIEESIKVLDEIAEGFEKLSEDVCARADIKAMWEGRAKGIRQAIAVINAHLRGQPNDPMTLSELREMDGEPVWVVFTPDADGERLTIWALVSVDEENDEVFLQNSIGGRSSYEEVREKVEAIYRRRPEEKP